MIFDWDKTACDCPYSLCCGLYNESADGTGGTGGVCLDCSASQSHSSPVLVSCKLIVELCVSSSVPMSRAIFIGPMNNYIF